MVEVESFIERYILGSDNAFCLGFSYYYFSIAIVIDLMQLIIPVAIMFPCLIYPTWGTPLLTLVMRKEILV